MVEIGYSLSSEEHQPNDLVRNACRAEQVGFTFALISDHYHPWVDRQGHSPFVWAVIGGIAQVTQRLQLGTGVTCPLIRTHPAIIAQAAATAAAMLPGRFFLGVGTGENLNEHVVGQPWPLPDVRIEMLEEAVELVRVLWQGGQQSYIGTNEKCCPSFVKVAHHWRVFLPGGGPQGEVEMAIFLDRTDAGRQLATNLTAYAHRGDVMVLALPRGGVPIAFQVAQILRVPLDVFIVRKLGVPGHEELAMGAVATGGVRVLNADVVTALQIPHAVIDAVTAHERQELERRERLYRDNLPPPDVHGKTVILVDDGLATGASMRAAVAALRKLEPARIVIAVPVGAPPTCDEFRTEVDEIVCAIKPEPFHGVGYWYDDFVQVTDQEVHDLLKQAAQDKQLLNESG